VRWYPWGMDALPWQPITPGFSLKVLHGGDTDDDPRTLLLRLEPGTTIARHRHGGDIHAVNLSGQRKLLDTGEVIGPQQYVYEPSGNVDSWTAIGDEPVIVFLVARGAIEYLDDDDQVTSRSTTPSVTSAYRRFCETAR
jgi:2,4'-dihydroxyacetophenone dioxygenase